MIFADVLALPVCPGAAALASALPGKWGSSLGSAVLSMKTDVVGDNSDIVCMLSVRLLS